MLHFVRATAHRPQIYPKEVQEHKYSIYPYLLGFFGPGFELDSGLDLVLAYIFGLGRV